MPFSIRLAVLALAATVASAEVPRYNQISLQAEVRREVVNDWVQATLYVEFSDPQPAALADRLNRSLDEALALTRAYPAIKAAVSGNQTYPLYSQNNKPAGWRGRADLRLESGDPKQLAELVGKLQAKMQLAEMNFSVAPASRDKAETELIDAAVKAFRQRAEAVQKSLGGKGYKLVGLAINTQQSGGPQPRFESFSRGAVMAAAPASPPVEAGSSQVTVSVNGTIELE
ncbi:SIMPL domain-containing protein [Chitinimonas lacunae]|uniref:SIMPL domain-containing protein n=1 Tax=Chitinimonas lacunae TaxID=1963018 RepID=A0ABV8MQN7_9NEIS